MTVLVQLSVAGTNTTLFDIYSNFDNVTPISTGVTKLELLEGYYVSPVPNGATTLRVMATGTCTSYTDMPISGLTTTTTSSTTVPVSTTSTTSSTSTTSTSTSTTTTTTTAIPSVIICDQEWSLYNLDVTTYSDGTVIPEVQDIFEWENLTTGAWCYYNNDPVNGTVYGKLYNWYAVAGIWDSYSISDPSLRKQLAPTGYHIPSYDEWMVLRENCLGGLNVAGGKMKATGTRQAGTGLWETPNTGATNESGFTGLPGGRRERDPGSSNLYEFMGRNFGALFWSSTETATPETSWHFALSFINTDLYRDGMLFNVGMSVRLIKD